MMLTLLESLQQYVSPKDLELARLRNTILKLERRIKDLEHENELLHLDNQAKILEETHCDFLTGTGRW